MTRKSEGSFEEGDFVVYPTHGVGRILGTEEREVAGTKLEKADGASDYDSSGQSQSAPYHVVTARPRI